MIQIKSQHQHQQQNQFSKTPPTQLQTIDKVLLEQTPKKSKLRKIKIKQIQNQDPNHYVASDALIPELQQSMQLIQNLIFDTISSRRKNLQLFVYTSLVDDGRDYLARLFKTQESKRQVVHQLVAQTVVDINQCVVDQILDGQHNVHKVVRAKKQDIFGNAKATEVAIRIKEQLLKAKLSDLKADINSSNIVNESINQSSLLHLNSPDLYGQNNEKTRKAKQFVKKMQEMQQEQRKQRQLKQEFKRQKRLQQQAQKKQHQQRMKRQKHQYLKMQYEQRRQQKQKQRKQEQERNILFQKFLQQYKGKTPLFEQKQKQFFDKFVIPQNNKKMQILKQIKQQRKPLSHEQLKEHEKQYMQIKQDHQYQKNAAKALTERTKKPEVNYYKSKFYNLVQKQQKKKQQQVDQFQIKLQRHQKKLKYSQSIKTKFIPKIDPIKRQEMRRRSMQLQSTSKIQQIKNSDSYKKDGKDNLQKLHKYIGELKAKGKVRYTDTSRTIQSSPQSNSVRFKNYLQQLRKSQTSSYSRKFRHHSIDYSQMLASNQDAERIKINLRKKQQSAQRRQQYLANLGNINLQKHMMEKRKLDEDYLQTVKAKLAIINKFQ